MGQILPMKKLFLALLIFTGLFTATAQQSREQGVTDLANKVAPNFCGCFEKYKFDDARKGFEQCFLENFVKHEEQLVALMAMDSIGDEQAKNDRIAMEIMVKMQGKLFQDCDSYYEYFKTIRNRGLSLLLEQDIDKKMDSIMAIEAEKRDSEWYFKKASFEFAGEKLNEAEKDLLKGFEKEPDNAKYKMLLAWVYEKQEREEDALAVYDQMIGNTGNIEFVMMKEFTKRQFRQQEKKAPDCRRFATGKFKIVDDISGTVILVKRTKTMQTEKNTSNNTQTKAKVEWLDDCTYIVEYAETTDPDIEQWIGKKLKVEILSSSEDSYDFKATMDGYDLMYFDQMELR